MSERRVDFFISHAGADRAWAEWVAWQLIDAGYTVELDVWDWAAGRNFVTAMSDALSNCRQVIALFSTAYFDRSRYTTQEWSSSLIHASGLQPDRLIPLRVEEVAIEDVPPVLRALVWRDVFGMGEEKARTALLEAIRSPRRPRHAPKFPDRQRPGRLRSLGGSSPRLPGGMPQVWNVPARNIAFTGRDGLLTAVREKLLVGNRAVVQALEGMGGVGKSQLAMEYAHRFAGSYDLAWWVASEQPDLIGQQFAGLAIELGCPISEAEPEVWRTAVLHELRKRGNWLIVFDNAEDPEALREWLPAGQGHVLITSRAHAWAELAVPVIVDVFARTESIALLCGRVDDLTHDDADHLAAQLGDLPLAIAQAAGFIAATKTTAGDYLAMLEARPGEVLDKARPVSYVRSLAAMVQVTADQLKRDDPAAAQLADLCAFLAPEPIPEHLFTAAGSELPSLIASRAADPLAWRQTLGHLTSRALVRLDQDGLQMHRLTQAILRHRLEPDQANATRACTERILIASNPGDGNDPATWKEWTRLLPHLLTTDLDSTTNPDLRELACDACFYLVSRGLVSAGLDLTTRLHRSWIQQLGNDDQHTLSSAYYLAWALRHFRRYAEAYALDHDTMTRYERLLGKDHPGTLAATGHLAMDLHGQGKLQAARDLEEDVLSRTRSVLGEHNPATLISIGNLAWYLRDLGELQAARDLDEKCLAQFRRILGEEHPITLTAASNLAADLRAQNKRQAAHDLERDTLAQRRRILGDNDRLTLISARSLARDLHALGQFKAARDLNRDTLARFRRTLGEDHPDTQETASNLAEDECALNIANADP